MNAYFDTSALSKLILTEDGSPAALACWQAVDDGYATTIGYLELRSSLDGARRGGRPAHADPGLDAVAAQEVWEELAEVELDAGVLSTAVGMIITHGLKVLDAIHLASALVVAGDEPLAMVSFDRRLRRAAAAEGLVVLPPGAP